jgi:hypothetical protein
LDVPPVDMFTSPISRPVTLSFFPYSRLNLKAVTELFSGTIWIGLNRASWIGPSSANAVVAAAVKRKQHMMMREFTDDLLAFAI